jgi:AmpE protein
MSFLVILICLTINYLWLKDFDRFDDGWFFRFRCRVESAMPATTESAAFSWVGSALLIYAIPMLIVAAGLFLASGMGFGIPTMLLHSLVLLIAFDRTQPGKLAADFLARWNDADVKGAELYLQQALPGSELNAVEDQAGLLDYFCRQLIYRCFEKMFVMFFWYMIAGPLAVLFSYVSYQLRDSHSENQTAQVVKTVSVFVWALEWAPMRLLAITFSLAGNFVQCFESVKESFWSFSLDSDNAALLYASSGCAMQGFASDEDDTVLAGKGSKSADIARGATRVKALLALLERSQAIWLAVLALITVFGL